MNRRALPRIGTVLFDEAHSESWTIAGEKAAEMQPDLPANSSYAKWASNLERQGFRCRRNESRAIDPEILAGVDVLVIPHPCDARWEATTGVGTPIFARDEMKSIAGFVELGGGLIIITEYEHSKYGDNLDQLAALLGVHIDSNTVRASVDSAIHRNPSWIGVTGHDSWGALDLLAHCRGVCFYRSGTVGSSNHLASVRTPAKSFPPEAALADVSEHGAGRVALVADSDIFGDEYWDEFDNSVFAVNLIWAVMPGRRMGTNFPATSVDSMAAVFSGMAHAVDSLRNLQSEDGTVPATNVQKASGIVAELRSHLDVLAKMLPDQKEYLDEVYHCLEVWGEAGFHRPDFGRAVQVFHAESWRAHGKDIVAVFPMSTPNASEEIRFEALWLRCVWPGWMQQLNEDLYRHDSFVPCALEGYTAGYDSRCAVLFPSSVSVAGSEITAHFGIILCSREARRFTQYCLAGASALGLRLPPDLDWMLRDHDACTEVFALWDLLHDKNHFVGHLPLIPFTEGVPQPYWMGAVEELRVDLEAIFDAHEIFRQNGNPMARMVEYAVVLDRILRFPVVGERKKNFDALAGQILMGFLIGPEVPEFTYLAGRLSVDWSAMIDRIGILRDELDQVYRGAVNQEPAALWRSAYRFVSKYVPPNSGSPWSLGTLDRESDQKTLLAAVLPDEFPLNILYQRVLVPRLASLEDGEYGRIDM